METTLFCGSSPGNLFVCPITGTLQISFSSLFFSLGVASFKPCIPCRYYSLGFSLKGNFDKQKLHLGRNRLWKQGLLPELWQYFILRSSHCDLGVQRACRGMWGTLSYQNYFQVKRNSYDFALFSSFGICDLQFFKAEWFIILQSSEGRHSWRDSADFCSFRYQRDLPTCK